jgi:tRNA pseudouridine55 synthase
MRDTPADGLLAIDKPAGITSHGVTDRLRRVLGTRRVGHAGTLDPFATGLLLLLVGRATRLLPFLDIEPKVYRATIRFGARTSTDDLEGEVIERAEPPSQDIVERGIAGLTGELQQVPPAFSAKSVGGVRAYAAARRGNPLHLAPVRVVVHEWRVLGRQGDDLDVEISCSGGTYIRGLARDLGIATGSAAHLSALRRLRSGRFSEEHAQKLEEAEQGAPRLMPMSAMVAHLPAQDLDASDVQRIAHGQSVTASVDGSVGALRHGDDLVAIAMREGDVWRPRVVVIDAA